MEGFGEDRKGMVVSMATKTVNLNELVLDWDIYPRSSLDGTNVRQLAQALEAGETLPPLLVDKTTRRVVDGFHRYHAYRKAFGEDHDIEVEFKDFASESDLFVESLRLNARHGRNFTALDRANALQKGTVLGLTVEVLSGALAMTASTLKTLGVERSAQDPSGEPVMVKHTLRHLRGRRLSQSQFDANDKAGGMDAGFYVTQILLLLDGNALDLTNEKLLARLDELRGKLERLLVTVE